MIMALDDVKNMIILKLHALGEELLPADHDRILLISRSIRDLHQTLEQLNGEPMRAEGVRAGGAGARKRRRRFPPPPPPILE